MNTRIVTLEQQMLSLISSVFDAYTVVLFLPDSTGEGNECQVAACFSLGDNVDSACRVKGGDGLVGWIMSNRKFLEVPDFSQSHHQLHYYVEDEPGIKAFMGCSLPGGGVLCVDTKRQFAFNERDHKLLLMFAAILSGVHGLDSYEQRESGIARYFYSLTALDELRQHYKNWNSYITAFLREVANATDFDYCGLAAVEVPGSSYAIVAENEPLLVHSGEPFYQSINSGLVGWALRFGQQIVQTGEEGRVPAMFGTSENLPEFASAVVLPVVIDKSIKCCLCLGHTQVHPVNDTMRAFLQDAVGMLTLHTENLYLRQRLSDNLELARVYTRGPRAHDPDTEPYQPVITDKED